MLCLSPGSGASGVCGGASPGEGDVFGHRVTPAVEDTRVVTCHRAGGSSASLACPLRPSADQVA